MSVVVLCGSARHRSDFDEAARRLVRETTNTIVAPCWAFSPDTMQEGDRERIVANNRRKIDLADILLVIDSDGYIGDGTRADIAYAQERGIRIEYWSVAKTGGAYDGHCCHAHLCPVEVPPAVFMCSRHWFRLPKEMRYAVWRTYTPGQEDRLAEPTDEYMRVTDEAIVYIAQKEGKVASLPKYLRHMATGPQTKLDEGEWLQ